MFSLSDYNYTLPKELIAQKPAVPRDSSRLLLLHRKAGKISHRRFYDFYNYLAPSDVLVINNTMVIPGRFLGRKDTGGKVEVLILDYASGIKRITNNGNIAFKCLVRSSKRSKQGAIFFFDHGLHARVVDSQDEIYIIEFLCHGDFEDLLYRIGNVPLPPYIRQASNRKADDDAESYQTIYAAEKGAIAAPTAGLHFTSELIKKIKQKGVKIVMITLHVGYGTFLPVRTSDIRKHKIHSEQYIISNKSAQAINQAKKNGGRVVAVGTTCVRTLEYAADYTGNIASGSGNCDLFIYPGYKFKIIDAMLTNFHLPESTLLMLVSAFAGRENILAAYKEAVNNRYRFYSYGDGMLIA